MRILRAICLAQPALKFVKLHRSPRKNSENTKLVCVMVRQIHPFFLGFLLLLHVSFIHAKTSVTPAGWVARAVVYTLEEAHKAGVQPSELEMSSLTRFLDIQRANVEAGGDFSDRTYLLRGKHPKNSDTGGILIAVTAYQVHDGGRDTLGRYAVWQKGDTFEFDWQSEKSIALLFASEGLVVPNRGVWEQDTPSEYLRQKFSISEINPATTTQLEQGKNSIGNQNDSSSELNVTTDWLFSLGAAFACLCLVFLVWVIRYKR
jgi:hypothetical protein